MAASSSVKSLERIFLALLIWFIPVFLIILGVKSWFPPLASEHGAGIDLMLNYLIVATGLLLVVGYLALGYLIWRFTDKSQVSFRLASLAAEKKAAIVTVIVMMLVAEGGVIVLGLPVVNKVYGLSGAEQKDVVVLEVTGEQFAWNVRYPGKDGKFGRTNPKLITDENPIGLDEKDPAAKDDIQELGTMKVPVHKPVRLLVRSKDVIHSFFLPHFRIKQDAVPGMTIDINLTPTVIGTYEVACAELCGLGHFQMRAVFNVVSAEEYEKWLNR
jgi:cytochrome c oxidase subunit 2